MRCEWMTDDDARLAELFAVGNAIPQPRLASCWDVIDGSGWLEGSR